MNRLLILLLLLFLPIVAHADLTITVFRDQDGARAIVDIDSIKHTVWAGDEETVTYGKTIISIGSLSEEADAIVLFTPISPTFTATRDVRYIIYCCSGAPDGSRYIGSYPRIAATEKNGVITITSNGQELEVTADRYYVGNMNTDKFHYHTCPSVDRMKESNKTSLFDRDFAEQAGFVPCKNCNP